MFQIVMSYLRGYSCCTIRVTLRNISQITLCSLQGEGARGLP